MPKAASIVAIQVEIVDQHHGVHVVHRRPDLAMSCLEAHLGKSGFEERLERVLLDILDAPAPRAQIADTVASLFRRGQPR